MCGVDAGGRDIRRWSWSRRLSISLERTFQAPSHHCIVFLNSLNRLLSVVLSSYLAVIHTELVNPSLHAVLISYQSLTLLHAKRLLRLFPPVVIPLNSAKSNKNTQQRPTRRLWIDRHTSIIVTNLEISGLDSIIVRLC